MSEPSFDVNPDDVLFTIISMARTFEVDPTPSELEIRRMSAAAIALDEAMREGRVPERWLPRWCLTCKRENVSEWTICEECLDQGWWAYCVDNRHASGPYATRDVAVEEMESFTCLGRHQVVGPDQLVGSCPACRRRDVPLTSLTERGIVKWLCGACL